MFIITIVNNVYMTNIFEHLGLSNMKEVALGVQHILADSISKDKDVFNILNNMYVFWLIFSSPYTSKT